jgi:TonB family protein
MPQSSEVLSFFASVTVRSLILFAVAAAVLLAFRVKAAAARHAIWTVVAAGMLLLAVLSPALPRLSLPVLKSAETASFELPAVPLPAAVAGPAVPVAAPAFQFSWTGAALVVYAIVAAILLARLAIGYLFTRRLIRAAAPIPDEENLYSSAWISVPLTIGRKVLLPADWDTWDRPKLDAVLAHERTHVRRGDWAIALMSGVNRCVFWFHPLSWWLERRLATLAEQACDDSALLLVDSQPYAQALLDMAAAVRTSQGRLVWEAMAMANAAEVRTRIERILDETRQIPRGLTRARWVALLACSVPLIWLVSVTHLVAQETPKTPAAMSEYLKGKPQLSPADVTTMEQYLVANPNDVEVRLQLILHYYSKGVRNPRIGHIVWLVENHPQTQQAIFASQGVLPRDNTLNTYAEYQRVREGWKTAVASRQGNTGVMGNASRFLEKSGELEEAEKLLLAGGAVFQGRIGPGIDQLARLYANAILGATGDPAFPNGNVSFAARVQRDLETSENLFLVNLVGASLRSAARRPTAGMALPPGTLNLDDHPLLVSAIDFGERLQARAGQNARIIQPREGVIGGVPGGVTGGVRGGVIGGIVGSVPSDQLAPANMPSPPVIKHVAPEYPPLARQARISGVVKLRAVIDTAGAVKHLQVISGHPLLVPASLDAVKEWKFQPPASEITTNLDVQFVLPPGDAPQATPGVQPQAPQRIRVGPNVHSAKLVRKVDPVYPPQARAEGIQGDVTLQILCDHSGQVIQADPIDGNPVLAAAAREAVRQWVYRPTLLNGQPVEVSSTVIVPFRLQ